MGCGSSQKISPVIENNIQNAPENDDLQKELEAYKNKCVLQQTELEKYKNELNDLEKNKNESSELEKYKNKLKELEKYKNESIELEKYKNELNELKKKASEQIANNSKTIIRKTPISFNVKTKSTSLAAKNSIGSLKKETLFHDNNFEYFDFSVGENDNSAPVAWLRPFEITTNPTMGIENIHPNEVQQGALGNLMSFSEINPSATEFF